MSVRIPAGVHSLLRRRVDPLRRAERDAAPRTQDHVEVADLLTSESFRSATAQLATKLGRDVREVNAEAADCLREMAAGHNARVAHAWDHFADWMVRGYEIIADDDELAHLRRLDRSHSLIFLISHRSYLDEFALPPQLVRSGLSPSYGLAGANLDFFPLGTIARRMGIVHVRRATADTPVYRLALRSYVGRLVAGGNNLVWSIEGGRSRTGKLRPPRYGLLRYVTDAVEATASAATLVVPVSIMYDQLPLHEVERMAAESRGLRKQPENLRWLLGYARGLENRLGRIYLDFGAPVPLQDRLAALRAEGLGDRQIVERVALDICHRINRTTPVSATAAVCVAMLGADRALTLDDVCATVAPLAHYLSRRGWAVAGAANLTDRATVRRTLQELVRSGVLSCFTGGPATVWGVGPDQHLIAAVYRNSAVHVLLVRAIAELALLAIVRTPDSTARTGWDEAIALRELLKFDFFFAGRDEFATELWDEVAIMAGSTFVRGAEISPSDAGDWLTHASPLVAHLVLRPFVDAYWVVAEQLVAYEPTAQFDEDRFVDECLRLGRQSALQRRIASEESISAEMFRTALKMVRHRGLIGDGRATADLLAGRRELAEQLERLQGSIAALPALHGWAGQCDAVVDVTGSAQP